MTSVMWHFVKADCYCCFENMSLLRILFVCVCALYYLKSVQSASLSVRSDNLQDFGLGMRAHTLVEGHSTGGPLLSGMITEEVEEITAQPFTFIESIHPTTMTEASGSPKWLKILRLVTLKTLSIIWIAMGICLCCQSSPAPANSTKAILTQSSAEVSTLDRSTTNDSTSTNSSRTVN